MTSSDRPAAAGVFVVRDPDLCAALEQLLAPHRTDPTPAPAGDGSAAVAALMADAEAHTADLTGSPTSDLRPDATVEGLLDLVYARAREAGELSGRRQSTAEGRQWSEEMQERVRLAESEVTAAEHNLDKTRQQLQDALGKIAELEARPSGRRPTVSALRLGDQRAFAELADRMDREALSQPKTQAAILRLASKSVRDEITAVYGPERKES